MFGRDRRDVAARARDLAWWRRGVLRAMLGFALAWAGVALPLSLASERYRIAVDVAEVKCLPQWLFLVDLNDKDVGRGDHVAFRSAQMEPYFPNGTLIVKILAGEPGDVATVDERGARVAGVHWGPLHYLEPGAKLAEAGRTVEDYRRTERIAPGTYWVMATLPGSYDSRYWGAIDEEQIVGRVYPLL